MDRLRPWLRCVALVMVACAAAAASAGTSGGEAHWVSAWTAASGSAGPALTPQSLRQVVRPAIGGSRLRLRLSNRFGTTPLVLGPVHVAVHAAGSAIVPGSDRVVSFGGKSSISLAPGTDVLSDPVALRVTALQELAVSLYLPAGCEVSTLHGIGRQTAYLAATDATAATAFPAGGTDDSRYFLTDIDVSVTGDAGALVVIGDSTADGFASTPDRNARWPDALAARLQADAKLARIAAINAGISGNRLLRDGPVGPSVLARLERDALDKPGVRWVLLQAGINDIGLADAPETPADAVTAQQIIDGMQALIARAHARHVAIWGATLLPCEGSELCRSAAGEARRQAVNVWMRGANAFDAVIDFDAQLRDPARPQRLQPALDSGDHLHPNDAGYAAMAAALDLRLFRR